VSVSEAEAPVKIVQIRGDERRNLVRDLAENNGTAAQLAEKYGSAEITISKPANKQRSDSPDERLVMLTGPRPPPPSANLWLCCILGQLQVGP
jgi:hypothetical protein